MVKVENEAGHKLEVGYKLGPFKVIHVEREKVEIIDEMGEITKVHKNRTIIYNSTSSVLFLSIQYYSFY